MKTLKSICVGVVLVLFSIGSAYAGAAAPPVDVPEPSTLLLLAAGVMGIGLFRNRKR